MSRHFHSAGAAEAAGCTGRPIRKEASITAKIPLEERLADLTFCEHSDCLEQIRRSANLPLAEYFAQTPELLEKLSELSGIPQDQLGTMPYGDFARRLSLRMQLRSMCGKPRLVEPGCRNIRMFLCLLDPLLKDFYGFLDW